MCFDTFHPSWNRLMPSPSTFLPLWRLWRYSRNSMRWNMQLDRAKSELASSTKRQRETKDELKIVAEELNLTVPEGAKITDIKNLIVNSDVYKNDKELVQSAIDYALAEIKNKRLDSETKLEFERIKLAQLQKQLELANIQKNLIENSDIQNPSVFETAANINVETLLKSVKTLTIPVPSRVESYNLFFQSLEKAFKIKEVPEQFKGEILLNILGERVNNLLVHVSEEALNNYSKLKDLVLKEFSPTPQECYNRFQKAQKLI
ncbi:uncharacterized protein TNCV_1905101 [Trichonephila clavipes]|nr:uncharacterized protein TNCV_1905101 [Trichonephila clavipes]